MSFEITSIVDFLKFYVPVLACGVFVLSFRVGSGWIYLLASPGSILQFVMYTSIIFVLTSFVTGSCVWALLSLVRGEAPDYLLTILSTLVFLVVASVFSAV